MAEKVYVFRCPVCAKDYRSLDPGEPCCTGPSESRHDHELTVMRLRTIEARAVSELGFIAPDVYAEARANGPLIFADTDRRVVDAVKRSLIVQAR